MSLQIRRGLEANLPASPLDGELLYSTDTNRLYVGYNNAANLVSGISLTALSVTDSGGDGSLSYNNTTGVFTYTGPSATEVRAHFSAGTGISITNGVIAATSSGLALTDFSVTDSGGDGSLSYNNTTGAFTYTGPSATEVRSHFSAGTGISITDGAISSTITQYTDSAARAAVSVTDSGGDGSLAYNSSTGVFTYTGPSATEVRSHFSAGTGISITDGVIAATSSGYANADVKTYLSGGTYDADIIPATDNTYSLGSSTKQWKDVYVGPGSLYINGKEVISDVSDKITVTTDLNQHLRLETSGTGNIEIATTGTGVISILGALQIGVGKNITSSDGNAINFANQIAVDSLTSKTTNTNLTLTANGTGSVYVDDSLVVTGNLTVSGTTTTINTETISLADNIIDLNSNFTTGTPTENSGIRVLRGDSTAVQMRWNENDDKWEYTNDGTAYKQIASLGDISVTDSGGDGSLTYNNTTGAFTYTGPSATEVRSHFSAGTGISITDGAISSTITQYTDAAARAAVSVTDSGGDGSLAYNSSTGAFTYTGPSATEVRSHFSAGTGIDITNGVISSTSTGGVTTGKAIAMAIVFGG